MTTSGTPSGRPPGRRKTRWPFYLALFTFGAGCYAGASVTRSAVNGPPWVQHLFGIQLPITANGYIAGPATPGPQQPPVQQQAPPPNTAPPVTPPGQGNTVNRPRRGVLLPSASVQSRSGPTGVPETQHPLRLFWPSRPSNSYSAATGGAEGSLDAGRGSHREFGSGWVSGITNQATKQEAAPSTFTMARYGEMYVPSILTLGTTRSTVTGRSPVTPSDWVWTLRG